MKHIQNVLTEEVSCLRAAETFINECFPDTVTMYPLQSDAYMTTMQIDCRDMQTFFALGVFFGQEIFKKRWQKNPE